MNGAAFVAALQAAATAAAEEAAGQRRNQPWCAVCHVPLPDKPKPGQSLANWREALRAHYNGKRHLKKLAAAKRAGAGGQGDAAAASAVVVPNAPTAVQNTKRRCRQCLAEKPRADFSHSQWAKKPARDSRCRACISGEQKQRDRHSSAPEGHPAQQATRRSARPRRRVGEVGADAERAPHSKRSAALNL